MNKNVGGLSKRHFQNNFIMYFIVIIFCIVGIIIGAILINRLTPEQNHSIIKRFNWVFDYQNMEGSMSILKSRLVDNAIFSIAIWLIGFTGLGIFIIPLMISWKGGVIGFTVGFLIKEFGVKGLMYSLAGLLPSYLIILPAILATAALGLSNSRDANRTRGKILNRGYKGIISDCSILFLLFFFLIIIGSVAEVFSTSYLLKMTKFTLQ